MVSHLRTSILKRFIYFMSSHFVTDFEFSCLAKPAKPYPMTCPTYLPQIPKLHCIQNCAHEVLITIALNRFLSVFT